MPLQVFFQALLKRWRAVMKARVECRELSLKRDSRKFSGASDARTLAAQKHCSRLAKELLLTQRTQKIQGQDGFVETLDATIIEVLKMAPVLHLAFVPRVGMGG